MNMGDTEIFIGYTVVVVAVLLAACMLGDD